MLRRAGTSLLSRLAGALNECPERSNFAVSFVRLASAAANPAYIDPLPEEPNKTFRARDIEYNLVPPSPPISLEGVKFGTVFTDHMFFAQHTDKDGWHQPAITPFGPLPIHPASQVLHYGMTCFEGMKAYQGADGRPRLFRPEMNMLRLQRSAQRLMLADFDPNELLECIKKLILVDKTWLPQDAGHSLCIRPFIYSSASVLGVARATETSVSVIVSPVGPYFPTGPQPITLFVDEETPRAWKGGVGEFKVGGNYAPTILPQVRAAREYGAQQVVYTEKDEDKPHDPELAHLDECGAMNVFFLLEKPGGRGELELTTSPLDGTIPPGVTRDSILTLARQWGDTTVTERYVTIKELRQASEEGRLIEAFGSGTACVVQPVAAFVRANGDIYATRTDVTNPRSMTAKFLHTILDIQYGRVADHPWSVPIDE